MKLLLDHRIYTDACISKAIYCLSEKYSINRRTVDEHCEELCISPLNDECNDELMEHTFLSVLNDYKLRQVIEDETHDIRTILYAKAFADFEDLDEDYV